MHVTAIPTFWDNASGGGLPVRSRHRVERPGVTIPSDHVWNDFPWFREERSKRQTGATLAYGGDQKKWHISRSG